MKSQQGDALVVCLGWLLLGAALAVVSTVLGWARLPAGWFGGYALAVLVVLSRAILQEMRDQSGERP